MRHGKVIAQKIAGTENVAGALTKYHGNVDLEILLARHGIVSGQCTSGALAEGVGWWWVVVGGGVAHLQ